MTTQERVEAMETAKLKVCAVILFNTGSNSAGFDAIMAELQLRLQDDFSAWCDETF